MLSDRCKAIVNLELEKLGISCGLVHLGEVELHSPITNNQLELLKTALIKSGLELVDVRVVKLIEKMKVVLHEMVQNAADSRKENFSNYLSEKVGCNYSYLSKVFSEVTGITIEHYIIVYKIELVKEFLLYDELLSVTEISYKLNYSSSAHLSGQFKKLTGLTPSSFRKLKEIKYNPLYVV